MLHIAAKPMLHRELLRSFYNNFEGCWDLDAIYVIYQLLIIMSIFVIRYSTCHAMPCHAMPCHAMHLHLPGPCRRFNHHMPLVFEGFRQMYRHLPLRGHDFGIGPTYSHPFDKECIMKIQLRHIPFHFIDLHKISLIVLSLRGTAAAATNGKVGYLSYVVSEYFGDASILS